ncbi:MAG: ABC transporter [Microbacterium sp.]|uniref:ABC transporter n=1 Tax=Microbacterium sp. TaxID=51671 RepID=UPI0039E2DF59
MSDPHAPEHTVDETEPPTLDDVVGQANEGLADAEAAGRDAVGEPEAVADAAPEPEPAERPWYERDDVPLDDDPAPTAILPPPAAAPEQPTEIVPAAVSPIAAPAASHSPQPIFVQAPEPPRPRGNRAAAGAIGLLAALIFGALYLAVSVGLGLADGSATDLGQRAIAELTSFALWVPVAVYFVAFWLLGAIINRGRWGVWVVLGLLVGVAAYGGHILGQLFEAPFWSITTAESEKVVHDQLLAPLAIAAFVIGREITIWFGAWVAARGKRVSELNYEAQREYERTLEAGPPIVPSAQG